MRIRYLESFYGGSHRDVADGIVRHSRHEIELVTMPARFWRWRMRAAGVHFAREIQAVGDRSAGETPEAIHGADLLVCTGLMSVTDLAALLGASRRGATRPGAPVPPILLYAHETQLGYPSPGGRPANRDADLHFACTDLTNMLAADHVAFNSQTHRNAYLASLPGFLRRMPEYRPARVIDEIADKSSICYPGIRVSATATDSLAEPPLILWNHRWEYDKDPKAFFAALRVARERGCAFRLALLGEAPGREPDEFAAARTELSSHLVHYGYVESRDAYEAWLRAADIVVSTAIQENFGISVVEAIAYGALPLLPNRLSYPEIIPAEHHGCLYEDGELPDRLCDLLRRPAQARRPPADLVAHARSFAWQERIGEFDALFDRVAGGGRA